MLHAANKLWKYIVPSTDSTCELNKVVKLLLYTHGYTSNLYRRIHTRLIYTYMLVTQRTIFKFSYTFNNDALDTLLRENCFNT